MSMSLWHVAVLGEYRIDIPTVLECMPALAVVRPAVGPPRWTTYRDAGVIPKSAPYWPI
jgi:hypothetical protein